eukprot:2760688-Amphidinium_carterae.2
MRSNATSSPDSPPALRKAENKNRVNDVIIRCIHEYTTECAQSSSSIGMLSHLCEFQPAQKTALAQGPNSWSCHGAVLREHGYAGLRATRHNLPLRLGVVA